MLTCRTNSMLVNVLLDCELLSHSHEASEISGDKNWNDRSQANFKNGEC